MNRAHTTPKIFAAASLLAAVPVALVVETLVCLGTGWRPYGTIEFALMLTVLVGAPTVLVVGASRSFRDFLARHGTEIVLACAGILAGWTMLEFGADHIDKHIDPPKLFHTRGPNLRSVFHPNPDLFMGITGTSKYTTDRHGVRAPHPRSPAAKHRVLCVGGSTTECTYLDDTETWPALLAAEPDTMWVGNVGISGFGTLEHLEFVESTLLLDDVDLVVVQAGINDLWRHIAREERVVHYDRFNESKAQSERPHADDTVLRARRPIWTRSHVIQLWHTLRQPRPEIREVEGVMGNEYAIRRQRRMDAVITNDTPDLDAGLEAFRANLDRIIVKCRARGVDLVMTTQPVLWRGDLPDDVAQRCWFGWLPDGRYLGIAQLRAAIDQYNEVTRAVCAGAGIPCVDLDAMNGEATYFYDDCHFTEAGAKVVADRVSPVVCAALTRQ